MSEESHRAHRGRSAGPKAERKKERSRVKAGLSRKIPNKNNIKGECRTTLYLYISPLLSSLCLPISLPPSLPPSLSHAHTQPPYQRSLHRQLSCQGEKGGAAQPRPRAQEGARASGRQADQGSARGATYRRGRGWTTRSWEEHADQVSGQEVHKTLAQGRSEGTDHRGLGQEEAPLLFRV